MLDTRYEDLIKQLLGSAVGARRSLTQPTTTPTYRTMQPTGNIDDLWRGGTTDPFMRIPGDPRTLGGSRTAPTGESMMGDLPQPQPRAPLPGGDDPYRRIPGDPVSPQGPTNYTTDNGYGALMQKVLGGLLAKALAGRRMA